MAPSRESIPDPADDVSPRLSFSVPLSPSVASCCISWVFLRRSRSVERPRWTWEQTKKAKTDDKSFKQNHSKNNFGVDCCYSCPPPSPQKRTKLQTTTTTIKMIPLQRSFKNQIQSHGTPVHRTKFKTYPVNLFHEVEIQPFGSEKRKHKDKLLLLSS